MLLRQPSLCAGGRERDRSDWRCHRLGLCWIGTGWQTRVLGREGVVGPPADGGAMPTSFFFFFVVIFIGRMTVEAIAWQACEGVCFLPSKFTPCVESEGKRITGPVDLRRRASGYRHG